MNYSKQQNFSEKDRQPGNYPKHSQEKLAVTEDHIEFDFSLEL